MSGITITIVGESVQASAIAALIQRALQAALIVFAMRGDQPVGFITAGLCETDRDCVTPSSRPALVRGLPHIADRRGLRAIDYPEIPVATPRSVRP